MKHTTRLLALTLLLASGAAGAHTGHGSSGFLTGLMHPFSGMDHQLAMLAVGLWAGQRGGRAIWLLPALFMSMLAAGAAAGMLTPALPLMEPGIAASVLVLGLLVASPAKLALPLSLVLTAAFGLFHGYAHGAEMPGATAPAAYALGFLASSAALHLAGIMLGAASRGHFARLAQSLGIAIATCGMWMLSTV
jgi:urease accessory protein